MDFEHSQKVKDLRKRLLAFMNEHIYPNEAHRNQIGKLELAKYKHR
jgi:acyl-CoA dehydrogenase